MKCSLLTLSTFIDGALPSDSAAEVDAHLVGCARCTAGVATLREEKTRISQLARVRLQPSSAQALLEQVGIGASTQAAPSRAALETPLAPADRPWLSARGGAALPWTPRRPTAPAPPPGPLSPATEEPRVPNADPDVQPDLPFDGGAPALVARAASGEVETVIERPDRGTTTFVDDDRTATVPLEPWEAAIPGYSALAADPPRETDPEAAVGQPTPALARVADPMASAEAPVPVAEGPMVPAPPFGPPRRAPGPSGPRALWERTRDSVAVRLALARGEAAGDDSFAVITGPAPPERRLPPLPGFAAPASEVHERDAHRALTAENDMELTGHSGTTPAVTARVETPAAPAAQAESAAVTPPAAVEAATTPITDESDRARWNAFGAAAFRGTTGPLEPAGAPVPATRPVGRHTRAVRNPTGGLTSRVSTTVATGFAALRTATVHGGRSARTVAGRWQPTRAGAGGKAESASRRRLVAAVAGVAVIFLFAILIGRAGSHPAAVAGHPSVSSASARTAPATAHSGAPSASAGTAAPGTAGAALTNVQTFGGSSSGFQVVRVRYGVFGGSQRIVFDLGTVTADAAGAPYARLGFTAPATLLLTFSGTLPAGSLAAVPAGGVVTSITRVAATGNTTTYRLQLARAATPVAFYLSGPLRFVLDLH